MNPLEWKREHQIALLCAIALGCLAGLIIGAIPIFLCLPFEWLLVARSALFHARRIDGCDACLYPPDVAGVNCRSIIADALEPVEREAAKERQGRPGEPRSGKFPEHRKGNALDKIAKVVGRADLLR